MGFAPFAVLSAAILACLGGTCHAGAYVFTNIADSNGIFAPTTSNFSGIGTGFLSINNFGVVAFSTGHDDGGRGVFKGSGGAITPIALSSGPVFSGLNGASINDAGTVAFSGGFDAGGSGVFTGNGGPTTTIATTSEGFTVFGIPMMNNTGRVAFGAGLGGNSGLFLRGDGPAATVALESGPIFSGLVGFSINSSGTVAFSAVLDSRSAGVFTGNGGPVATIAFADFPASMIPSSNDVGTVAFSADPIGADLSVAARILIGNGGPIVTYVSNAGPFSAFGIYPITNNFGLVAFLGGLDSTGQAGIFTGPDPATDKVILTGESLFSSTLTSLASSGVEHPGIIDLNDSGQIAFHYQLADGRQGIAVGTPVPEPQTAIVLGLGAFIARRRSLGTIFCSLLKQGCGLIRLAAVGMWLLTGFANSCQAGSYIFTNIADSSGIFAPTEPMSGIGNGFLSINNSGTVAFGSGLDDGSFGVFKGNGGPTTPIALSSGPVFSLVGGGSINNSGTVAFFGQLDAGGSGIFIGDGGSTSSIAISSEGFTGFGGAPRIDDAGRVLFGGNQGGGGGLFLRGGGQPSATVAIQNDSTFGSISGAAINSLSTVAFSAALRSGAQGVFTGNGGPVTTIALENFPGGMDPSINDLGTVAFSADPIGPDLSVASRILIGNGEPIMTYVSNAGPFSAFGIYPIINNSGVVTFLGGLDSTGQAGVFAGPDPVADKIILTGESLFGSVLTSLVPTNIEHAGIIDLNDSGQIAFHYQLADGRQGIAVATPVPEPAFIGLLVAAGAVMSGRRFLRSVLVRLRSNFCGFTRRILLRTAMLACLACTCHAASYVFTNIADSNGIFAPTEPMSGIGNGFLSINNSGTVAFGSGLDDGSFGVFKGNGGPVTSIALSSGPVFSLVGGASINSAGTVAFFGQLDAGGTGIFTGNGGPTTPVALSSEGFTGFGLPRMNDAGRVAFNAGVSTGNIGLLLRGGGPPATVAVESGPIFSSLGDFSINNAGTVAFRATLDSGSRGTFIGNGGPITTIALSSAPQGTAPSINDLGTVIFVADNGSGVATMILMGNGGPVTTFVSNSGPFSGFGIFPEINNNGTVAFLGGLDDGRVGVFAGPDSVADKVIASNEPLFGSTLVGVIPGSGSQNAGAIDINDSGQIAFHYQLADGRQGIAVATPVPEPQSAVALVMGVIVLCFRRWQHRGWKIAGSIQERI